MNTCREGELRQTPTPLQEHPICNSCGGTVTVVVYEPKLCAANLLSTFSASHGILGAQRIVRCVQCGLVYVCPRLRANTVLDAYTQSVDELYVSQAAARIDTFRRSAGLITKYLRPPGLLLDVGAAAGFFCKAAAEAGWTTTGVEPSRWLAEWGRANLQQDVRAGVLEDQSFPDSHFDIVTMWDSIEHMPDPLRAFKECRRILKPDGLLLINTLNFGSIWAKLFRQNWWFLLSHHLYYFTPKTIADMLAEAGLRTVAVRRHNQTLELSHLIKMAGLYSKTLSRALGGLADATRLGRLRIPYYASQMNVIARKGEG